MLSLHIIEFQCKDYLVYINFMQYYECKEVKAGVFYCLAIAMQVLATACIGHCNPSPHPVHVYDCQSLY